MSSDVACLDIAPVPEGRQRSRFLAVGSYNNTIRILSLDPHDFMHVLSVQSVTAAPESLLFLEVLALDMVTGQLLDARSWFLGLRGPKLFGWRAMLCLSSKPWLGYVHQRHFLLTPISYETLEYAASFSSDQCVEGVVVVVGDALRVFTLERIWEAFNEKLIPLCGPYKPTTVLVQALAATDDSPVIPEHTTVETPMNMSPKNKAHFKAEKEAINLILTGIGDEIYSTIDACQIAQKMWEAIERLQQGESLNIQDPEWSMFVMIVKQQHKLDKVSYHKLFDILKQYQKEVNELRAERLARNANPLALVATAQANQDPYYQTSKSHKSYAPSSKPSIPTRTYTTTRYKGKEIVKPITPPFETASEEDSDLEQAQRDNDMQKNLALISKYFKIIYKPTNNNLRTSSNSRSKNVDTTLRVLTARNLDIFLRNAESQKGLRTPHTDDEIDEQELEAHYSYMENIQEVPTADSGADSEPLEHAQNDTGYNLFANDLQQYEQSKSISNTCLVETNDNNVIPDSPNMCNDDIQNDQNDVESDDERVAVANLIANFKIDVDENKKIQKQLKKANTTLAQELKECKTILVGTSKTLGESNSVWDSCLVALQNKQTEFEKYKAFNDRTVDYDKLELVKEKHDELIKQSLLTKSHYEGLVKQKIK
nr:splicing factor 3B subunit 3-like [Tanacetum cinerariifolium]